MAQVRARVDGIVLKRDFKEGGDVKAGQRLYQIDPAPYIAALNSATASLQKAEANLASTTAQAERYKVLVAANAVSKQDYDNAVSAQGQAAADVATGKAAVALAQINLGYTERGVADHRSQRPVAGHAGRVRAGERRDADDDRPADRSDLRGPHAVERRGPAVAARHRDRPVEARRVPIRRKSRCSWKTERNIRTPGTLQFTDITVDQGTGSVTVRAIFPNPRFVLLPGMFVRARIEEGVNDNAFLVPQVGVTHDPKGQATALVVGADNKVAVRTLQLDGHARRPVDRRRRPRATAIA